MRRTVGWRSRVVIAGLAALLPALGVLGSAPAGAADGTSPVSCATGSSCYVQILQWVHFGGDYSPGTGNTVVDIQPPACSWDPVGNAQTGSQYIVNYYDGDAPAPSSPYDQYASYTQAKTMLAAGSTEAGEWYYLPDAPYDTAAQAVNTSLGTGAVLPGQAPSDSNYYRYSDELAPTSSGQWQVVSAYQRIYYPQAKECKP